MVQFLGGNDVFQNSLCAMFLDIGMINMISNFYHKIESDMAESVI